MSVSKAPSRPRYLVPRVAAAGLGLILRMVDGANGRSRSEDGFVEQEWRITLALIREMAWVSRDHGARFVLVILPVVVGKEVQRTASDRLKQFLREEGIETVDLQDSAGFASGEGLVYPVDGHPTAEWHRRVGDLIATSIDP